MGYGVGGVVCLFPSLQGKLQKKPLPYTLRPKTTNMMIRSPPSQPGLSVRCPKLFPVPICCSSTNNSYNNKSNNYIPKREPFTRRKIDGIFREPSLIEKTENDLADYCSTLEGESSYSCWETYFELKELEKEVPKQEVEKLILESGGVKSLIGYLHGISQIHKTRKTLQNHDKFVSRARTECPVPDGLPKSLEEMEEEENWKMPDSSFTRLLRSKGTFPAWFSPVPDHETD
ncbi:CCG-binding protein 1-like [Rutidosis leptorrhynchoides]|uniref:CCG-binding protein 1-like n=1 Tax=Rutidosis leptorrhynchoides TaxID=125765 RepID=UPI003A99A718